MKIDEIETTSKHIKLLVKDLRPEDEDEIKAKTGTTNVQKTLLTGFAMTDYCRSFFVDDKIAGVYGVVASLDNKDIGSPFLLCTPKIKKLKIKFLRECKNRVEEMSDKFPILFNYIDSRNKLHLTWLKWCGFKIINEKTFNDVLFYGFLKEKKK
jgi:hypothetical protein|tara:strand:- start:7872 stop:8333 length:462 start_codon:yes stop_codon:yes gene_type:complete